ncbi:helix-turn-helix transcriptional regulator [Phenylobacterium sp.]|uniref:helix-turn-helix transcriptional regulator n=1 Tax=Phenylobacterium sp. TaxID=1871053 RepID=UPI003BA92D3E
MNNTNEYKDPVDILFGTRVRLLRKQRGLSQDELAQAIDVTTQQLQNAEQASVRTSLSMASRVAKALGTTVGDLIGERDAGGHDVGDLAQVMSQSEVLQLVRAFSRLSEGEQRGAVVDLVVALAAED